MERRSGTMMKMMIVLMMMMMMMMMMVRVEGGSKDDGGKRGVYSQKCYRDCYNWCPVKRHTWCATLCSNKCAYGGPSIPDALCNCLFSCTHYICPDFDTDPNTDPKKVQNCLNKCHGICDIKLNV